MSQITVCVDAYHVHLEIPEHQVRTRTISVGHGTQTRRERVTVINTIESGWENAAFNSAISAANTIWEQAEIRFTASAPGIRCFRPPGDVNRVTDGAYQYLINQTHGQLGRITLLLVRQFARWDLGGQASRGTCILPSTLSAHNRGRVFAHEFGHLLGLPHLDTYGEHMQNLMRPGLVAGNDLLDDQIDIARASPLATRASAVQPQTAAP